MTQSATPQIVRTDPPPGDALSPMAQLAAIPEEEIWLAKQKSARPRCQEV
jgi:hypothetical protein